MRYIMILSLCLVGFEGYAASAANPDLPAPRHIKGPEFHKILQEGYFVHSGNTWKPHKTYEYNMFNTILSNLYLGMPIDSINESDCKDMLECMNYNESWAFLMPYSQKNHDRSPYLSHDNQHIFYYAGNDTLKKKFYVVFKLVNPAPTL